MGWLEGLLSGYADQQNEIRKDEALRAEKSAEREGNAMKALLNSEDPWVRTHAATGLLMNSQPQKRKGGFSGWMGEMEANPMYPKLLKYITTPQQIGEDTKTTVTTPQQAGYLPTLPKPTPPLAQTSSQTTTPGAAPLATPQPQPSTVATPPPQMTPEEQGNTFAGVAPGTLSPEERAINFSNLPPTPPSPPPPPPAALAAPPGAAPTAAAAPPPTAGGPPPAPPDIPQLGPDQLRGAMPPEQPTLDSLRVTTHTPIMGLPHSFPTQEDEEVAKTRAQIRALQEAYKEQGDPDWQKKGMDAYMAEHARASAFANQWIPVEYTDPKTGKIVEDFGSYDRATRQFYGQDGMTPLPADARPVAKTGGGALSPSDQAAIAMGKGYRTAREVPEADYPAFLAKQNEIAGNKSAATGGGTARGRFEYEKTRVNLKEADDYAREIAGDISKSGPLLSGRTQAFKEAVGAAISAHGGNVMKISESTRQMAETASDILPMMDKIALDAKEFDRLGMMGPVAGRWQDFLTGKLGVSELAGDPSDPNYRAKVALAGKFRTEVDLLQKAVLRAHAGARGAGSPEGLERMEGMLSVAHMDLGTFLSSMSGFKGWMDTYAKRLLPAWGGTPGMEPDHPDAEPPPTVSLSGPDADMALAALHAKYTSPEMAAAIAAMEAKYPAQPGAGGPPQLPAQVTPQQPPQQRQQQPAAARPAGPPGGLRMRNGVLVYPDGRPF